ncbi:TIGR03086 family metal-binding protein [Rhodococcus sp. NPDC003348]
MTSTIEDLGRALDATATLVAAVADDQWSAPTPCTDWSVHQLVNHLTAGNHMFASALHQRPLPVAAVASPPDLLGPDPAGSFRAAADALVQAFAAPGALESEVDLPIRRMPATVALNLRTVETITHGWDLARAIGQPTAYDDAVIEEQIAFSRALIPQLPPGRTPFAPPQPVTDDAPPIDRLVALLGRTP